MRDIGHIMFEGKKIQGYGKLGAEKPVQEGEAWRGSGREALVAWRHRSRRLHLQPLEPHLSSSGPRSERSFVKPRVQCSGAPLCVAGARAFPREPVLWALTLAVGPVLLGKANCFTKLQWR